MVTCCTNSSPLHYSSVQRHQSVSSVCIHKFVTINFLADYCHYQAFFDILALLGNSAIDVMKSDEFSRSICESVINCPMANVRVFFFVIRSPRNNVIDLGLWKCCSSTIVSRSRLCINTCKHLEANWWSTRLYWNVWIVSGDTRQRRHMAMSTRCTIYDWCHWRVSWEWCNRFIFVL